MLKLTCASTFIRFLIQSARDSWDGFIWSQSQEGTKPRIFALTVEKIERHPLIIVPQLLGLMEREKVSMSTCIIAGKFKNQHLWIVSIRPWKADMNFHNINQSLNSIYIPLFTIMSR